MRKSVDVVIVIVLAMLLASAGFGYGLAMLTAPRQTANAITTSGPTKTGQRAGVYQLTLVEAMNTPWNATVSEPSFFVLGAHGLESAANLSLPANRLIELTIVAYDTPTEGSTDQMGVVRGTMGGTMYLLNGTLASMDGGFMPWGINVTSVPGGILAHTFTIPQLGVNVPVVGGDTQIVYLYFTKTGTFTWLCAPPCGDGPDGNGGAMKMPGWMTGSVTVS